MQNVLWTSIKIQQNPSYKQAKKLKKEGPKADPEQSLQNVVPRVGVLQPTFFSAREAPGQVPEASGRPPGSKLGLPGLSGTTPGSILKCISLDFRRFSSLRYQI